MELTFEYGTNDYSARQVVTEKLRGANLTDGATPSLGPLSTPIGELFRYSLEAPPGNDEIQPREIQDWIIAPRILQVLGIADVVPFGGLVKQYQIEIDPLSLEKYNLTINHVAAAVNANNKNAGGAMLDNRHQSLVVRGVGPIRSVEDIGNIDTEEKVRAVLPLVAPMVREGLILLQDAEVISTGTDPIS